MSQYHKNTKKLLNKIGKTGTCAYCGKEESHSPDHIIPIAVYKWTSMGKIEDYDDADNLVIACEQCNERKGCTVPAKNEALRIKPSCGTLYDKLYPAITKYNSLINELIRNQKHRCGFCQRTLSKSKATIRRIDDHAERNINNAILLCSSCNRKWIHIRYSCLHKQTVK